MPKQGTKEGEEIPSSDNRHLVGIWRTSKHKKQRAKTEYMEPRKQRGIRVGDFNPDKMYKMLNRDKTPKHVIGKTRTGTLKKTKITEKDFKEARHKQIVKKSKRNG